MRLVGSRETLCPVPTRNRKPLIFVAALAFVAVLAGLSYRFTTERTY